jgi:hypothetical protein
LDVITRELRAAGAGIASLNAELRAAEEIQAKLEAEVDMWRGEDAEYPPAVRSATGWKCLLSGREVQESGMMS